MKKFDVRQTVMDKVAGFERRRSRVWVGKFILVVTLLMLGFAGSCWFLIQKLSDRQSWELLTLFGQDPEIIKEYWQDTLWIFWEEMPHRTLTIVGIVLLVLILFIVATRRKRKIIQKRMEQLAKYR